MLLSNLSPVRAINGIFLIRVHIKCGNTGNDSGKSQQIHEEIKGRLGSWNMFPVTEFRIFYLITFDQQIERLGLTAPLSWHFAKLGKRTQYGCIENVMYKRFCGHERKELTDGEHYIMKNFIKYYRRPLIQSNRTASASCYKLLTL
jgi:hypothetical protein